MSFVKELDAGKLAIKVYKTREFMGQEAAKEVAAKIRKLLSEKSEVNIYFEAAPSQNEFLKFVSEDSDVEWSRVNAFQMDEFIDPYREVVYSLGDYLRNRIFGKLPFKSVNYMDGRVKDIEAECKRYSELFKNYPPDIVCLGIGENGHIGLNDPEMASFSDEKPVRIVGLDFKTRNQQVKDGFFESFDRVPKHAITLTVPALMSARNVFCIVPAKSKADAVFSAVNDEITEECPATILRTHDNAVLFTDSDSAGEIVYWFCGMIQNEM